MEFTVFPSIPAPTAPPPSRNGSIVVDYDVIVEIGYSPKYEEMSQNLTREIEVRIKDATAANQTDCSVLNLCYNDSDTRLIKVSSSFDPQRQCINKTIPEFSQFYRVLEVGGKLVCVNNCTQDVPGSVDCNLGKCQLELSGPRCYCVATDTHWYRGQRCETSVRKSAVYGSLGAVGLLLLVVIVALSVFLCQSRLRSRKELDKLIPWMEEDNGTDVRGFRNVACDVWEDDRLKNDNYSLSRVFGAFQPSLGGVDANARMRIQRPEVVTSL
ncbi:mucin-17-like [Tachyglossus aculeatus]|uniref:mucin-17-like n=1 Tax=Tachyglossus aculeatus TaxID=9261 RepID=UPI0018F520FB|nr:mucin-17-like [Tachyglossus aculeatus]